MGARDLDTRIRGVLERVAGRDLDAHSLTDRDNLYDAGLKSLATLHFLLALEAEFGVEFPESMLHQDAFASLAKVRASVVGVAVERDAPRDDRT
jgi:acyl carrier protein